MGKWFVLSNTEGTILAVYGGALEADAITQARKIATSTRCAVALHTIMGERPHVNGTISMKGDIRWP